MNVGLGVCFVKHHDEATSLVNEAPLSIKMLIIVEVKQGSVVCTIYSYLVITEGANQEQLTMIDLESHHLSKALTLRPDLPDALVN